MIVVVDHKPEVVIRSKVGLFLLGQLSDLD